MIGEISEIPDLWDLTLSEWKLDSRTARFAGESKTVYVAMRDVAAIFARETGRGLAFAAEKDAEKKSAAADDASRLSVGDEHGGAQKAPAKSNGRQKSSAAAPDHLRLI